MRDSIYVDDVVSAYLAILQKTAQLPTFNQFDVGTGSLNIVRSMVEVIKAAYEQQHTTSKTQLNFGALPYRNGEKDAC